VSVVILLSGLAWRKKCDRKGHYIQFFGGRLRVRAGDYVFDHEVLVQLRSREGTNSKYWGLNHPLCCSGEKENPRVIFVTSDESIV